MLTHAILFDEEAELLTKIETVQPRLNVGIKKSNRHDHGKKALHLADDQTFPAAWPGVAFKVRWRPGPGEIRYMRLALGRQGGVGVGIQLGHDGRFGPDRKGRPNVPLPRRPAGETLGASLTVAEKHENQKYVVVTRDLYADFGEFTLTGLGPVHGDTQVAYFDQLIVGATSDDLEQTPAEYGAPRPCRTRNHGRQGQVCRILSCFPINLSNT
ncbi:MAG: hypothetical protein QM757_28225, partial [Paludibaculum sp.]